MDWISRELGAREIKGNPKVSGLQENNSDGRFAEKTYYLLIS